MLKTFFVSIVFTVLELLKKEKEIQLPLHVIGAISILEILKSLNLDLTDQLTFFSQTGIDKTELSGFKEWRKIILSPPPPILQGIFDKRSHSLSVIANKVKELKNDQQLTTSFFSIITSIIHMHCNRLVGIERKIENKVRAYAGYALQNPFPKIDLLSN